MKRLCLLMCLMAVMTGCATTLPNLNIEEMAANGLAGDKELSAQGMITLAEEDITRASNEELDYYAPRHLAMAEEHLKKAQNLMVSGGGEATALTEAAFARKVVEKGLMVKQTVLRQLNDIFDMKERLKAMKAEVYFRDEFDDQMAHIRKLIYYIEKGDQASVDKKKTDYLNEMLALEVDVVKKKILTESIDTLKKARDLDAKKLAPKTYKTADDTLARSTVFIESFPRDEKGVAKAGLDALRACQHALYVTREVISIKAMDKNDFEDLILDFENKLHRITQGLGEEDVRYMSLHDQSVALSSKAEELQRTSHQATLASAPVDAPAPDETDAPDAVYDEDASEDQAPAMAVSVQEEDVEKAAVSPEDETAVTDEENLALDEAVSAEEESAIVESEASEAALDEEDVPGEAEPAVSEAISEETPAGEETLTGNETLAEEPLAEAGPTVSDEPVTDDLDQGDTAMAATVAEDADSSPAGGDKDVAAHSEDTGTSDNAPEPKSVTVTASKKEEPAPKESWNGDPETFNMDDLYLSDEERALKNK